MRSDRLAASAAASSTSYASPSGPSTRASRRFLAPAQRHDTFQRALAAVFRRSVTPQPVGPRPHDRPTSRQRSHGSTAACAILDSLRSNGRSAAIVVQLVALSV